MLYKLAVATFLAGVSAETCKIVADPAVTSFKTETFGFKGEVRPHWLVVHTPARPCALLALVALQTASRSPTRC